MAYPMQGWQQPYGGYYPPMQDQLAQLRSQPYMPQQPAQQSPAQNSGGIIWVQGEAAAKSYPVSPGSGVLLMDKTTPRLIQFHTLKNAVNPPFLGGFLISGTVAA